MDEVNNKMPPEWCEAMKRVKAEGVTKITDRLEKCNGVPMTDAIILEAELRRTVQIFGEFCKSKHDTLAMYIFNLLNMYSTVDGLLEAEKGSSVEELERLFNSDTGGKIQ